MAATLGFEPGPHWWEASALTTAPPSLPKGAQIVHGNFNLLTAISILSRHHSWHFSLRSPPVNFGGRQWPLKVKTQNQKSIFNVDLRNEK